MLAVVRAQVGTCSASQRAAASHRQEVCQTRLVAISHSELPENVMFFSKPGESAAETAECGFPRYDILKKTMWMRESSTRPGTSLKCVCVCVCVLCP